MRGDDWPPAAHISSPASMKQPSITSLCLRCPSAAYAGRGVESLAASQCVDVLHALRQRHFKPAFAAILSAEHLAIARRNVDLLGVAVMQTDRHQRAVRRHPVEALPSLADVLAAVERAVFR